MHEPKDAVRKALNQYVKGHGSGSWLTADPRPNLDLVNEAIAKGDETDFYDFLLSIAELAASNAQRRADYFRSEIIRGVEAIAEQSDSLTLYKFIQRQKENAS